MLQQFSIFRSLYIATLLVTGTLVSFSQETLNLDEFPPLPSAQENDAVCRCITTFIPKKGEHYFLKIGKTYYHCPLAGENISVDLPIRGVRTFTLYKKVTTPEGEDVYQAILEKPLAATGKRFLVVLKKNKDNSLSARSHNLSSAAFPANRIYIMNECPLPLGLDINDTKAGVKPYQSMTYDFSGSNRKSYTTAKIIMRYKDEDKVMGSKRLRLVPGRRIILVCLPCKTRAELGSTPVRMVSYQDMP